MFDARLTSQNSNDLRSACVKNAMASSQSCIKDITFLIWKENLTKGKQCLEKLGCISLSLWACLVFGWKRSVRRHLLCPLKAAELRVAAPPPQRPPPGRTDTKASCLTNWGLCRGAGQMRIKACVCVVMFIKAFQRGLGQQRTARFT